MPEYVTSFLLARNVELQFSGLDSKSISKGMEMIAGASINVGGGVSIGRSTGSGGIGGYNMFSFSASVGVQKGKQSVTADYTAKWNGDPHPWSTDHWLLHSSHATVSKTAKLNKQPIRKP